MSSKDYFDKSEGANLLKKLMWIKVTKDPKTKPPIGLLIALRLKKPDKDGIQYIVDVTVKKYERLPPIKGWMLMEDFNMAVFGKTK